MARRKFKDPSTFEDKCEWCPDVKGFCAYIIMCRDRTMYKGFTSNLKKRMLYHFNGEGSLYTKGHKPWYILHYEVFEDRRAALQREAFFKENYNWIIENKGHFNMIVPKFQRIV